MTAKILVMGENKNYYLVKYNQNDVLNAVRGANISSLTNPGEKVMNLLQDLNSSVSALNLKNYGGTIPLDQRPALNYLPDKVYLFLEDAVAKANKHGADYALIQELKIEGQNNKVSGLVQLLLEESQ